MSFEGRRKDVFAGSSHEVFDVTVEALFRIFQFTIATDDT